MPKNLNYDKSTFNGSVNDLVSSDNEPLPEPMLAKFYD